MTSEGAAPHPYARWLALAFDETEARHASAAIAFHRDGREELGLLARSYEVVLPAELPPLRAFLDALVDRLSSHLLALRQAPGGTPGVFLSVFAGDRLHFIGSEETVRLRDELHRGDPPVALLPGRKW